MLKVWIHLHNLEMHAPKRVSITKRQARRLGDGSGGGGGGGVGGGVAAAGGGGRGGVAAAGGGGRWQWDDIDQLSPAGHGVSMTGVRDRRGGRSGYTAHICRTTATASSACRVCTGILRTAGGPDCSIPGAGLVSHERGVIH